MTANVGTNRKVYVTIEVANAIGNYMHFMDAGAGAYSNEMALKAGKGGPGTDHEHLHEHRMRSN